MDTYLFTLTREFTCEKFLSCSLAIVHAMLFGRAREVIYFYEVEFDVRTAVQPHFVQGT